MPRRIETRHPQVNQITAGYFRQRKGYYAWRPKGTTDWLLIYTIGGRGRIGYATDGAARTDELIAEPGDAVILQPGTMHDYGVEPTRQRWELLWAHFHPRPAWHEWLAWPAVAPGLLRLTLSDAHIRRKIVARFGQVNALANGPLRHAETFAMNALEEVLLWCDVQNPRSQGSPMDARVRAATEYLCRNLREKVTLDALAEHCHLSASRLSHLFRVQVGYTPQQFLELQRMNRATQLLEMTSQSIKEISREVGFDNPFYFTLRFKKLKGSSPRAFRQR
jgi:AraC family transcriptional regulator of arabinose operon